MVCLTLQPPEWHEVATKYVNFKTYIYIANNCLICKKNKPVVNTDFQAAAVVNADFQAAACDDILPLKRCKYIGNSLQLRFFEAYQSIEMFESLV